MVATMKAPSVAADTCPRCFGALRKAPGDLGARSRVTVDREITICSRCGEDEASRQHIANEMIPPSDWPVLNGAHDYRPGGAL